MKQPTCILTLRNALRSRRLAAVPSPPSSRKILARPSRRSTAHSTTMRCLSFISTLTGPDHLLACSCASPPQRTPLTLDAWPLQLTVTFLPACTVRPTCLKDGSFSAFSLELQSKQTGSHQQGDSRRTRRGRDERCTVNNMWRENWLIRCLSGSVPPRAEDDPVLQHSWNLSRMCNYITMAESGLWKCVRTFKSKLCASSKAYLL